MTCLDSTTRPLAPVPLDEQFVAEMEAISQELLDGMVPLTEEDRLFLAELEAIREQSAREIQAMLDLSGGV